MRATVRLERAPLGRTPSIDAVVAAIDGLRRPFLLAGRWGLPAGADPEARTVVAGAEPAWVLPVDADPFAAFDDVPRLDGDAPAGTIGGGLVGWLGFDLGRSVERTLGPQPVRPKPLAAAQLAWHDDVLRRDSGGVWWVETLVDPEASPGENRMSAALATWRARLDAGRPAPTGSLGRLVVDGGTRAHLAATGETIERIHAGELFQANVCLRLEGPLVGQAAGIVGPVIARTDPWYGAWIGGGDGAAIVSSSPELFLRRTGREVVTGPIKGTAPRTAGSLDPAGDPAARALLASAKDHAEHVMIVDLMRNDLGRVCDYGSVRYEAEPRIEPHAGVWHLVSEVAGRLHDGWGDGRLLRATFPPGSVTGAPKVQAMRVIAAVEGTGREVYTGAHGIASPASGLELAVTIRTIEIAGDQAWVGAGGGIVADSVPESELQEALGKAAALVAAAGGTIDVPAADPAAATVGVPWMRSADRRPDPHAGLLETFLAERGRVHHAGAHLGRLAASVAALGYPALPGDLAARVDAAALAAGGRARIRVLAEPVGDRLGVEVQTAPPPPVGLEPVRLEPFVWPGGVGPHKWLDRALLDDVTARLGASPLLLDAAGAILEAGWANIWWVEDGALCTPPLDGRQLPGITRAVLLDRRDEAPLPLRELRRVFDDAFTRLPLLLTSTRGVSVARLPGTPDGALERATELARALAPLVIDVA